jgi:acetyl esterase
MPVDPCFAALIADPRNTVRPPPSHVPLSKVRKVADGAMAQLAAPDLASVVNCIVSETDRDIPIRLYRPKAEGCLPIILFCHGGGWVWGSLDTHDGLCRNLAARTGATVVSVGYRLSPETTFPGAAEDVLVVLNHLRQQDATIQIDPDRMALCGDSAGGHIVVTATLKAMRAGVPIRHLGLFYPALDPACDSDSFHEFAEGPVLTKDAMTWFWSCYLGEAGAVAPDFINPMQVDLSGFPATTIMAAECDVLRDEARSFAERLTHVQPDVVLRTYPGMIHGFLSLAVQSQTIEGSIDEMSRRIARSLNA